MSGNSYLFALLLLGCPKSNTGLHTCAQPSSSWQQRSGTDAWHYVGPSGLIAQYACADEVHFSREHSPAVLRVVGDDEAIAPFLKTTPMTLGRGSPTSEPRLEIRSTGDHMLQSQKTRISVQVDFGDATYDWAVSHCSENVTMMPEYREGMVAMVAYCGDVSDFVTIVEVSKEQYHLRWGPHAVVLLWCERPCEATDADPSAQK